MKELKKGESYRRGFLAGEQAMLHRLLAQVSPLRRWLNEDRIDDCKKLVSDADIINWLAQPSDVEPSVTWSHTVKKGGIVVGED